MKRVLLVLILFTSHGALAQSGSQVPFERIAQSDKEPGNWLTYSGNTKGHRYSSLRQITRENVAELKPLWVYQIDRRDKFETSPIVVDGVMYITEPPSHVTALDTRTGRSLWAYRRGISDTGPVCCGTVNRGVAVLDDLVFVGTIDAHLVALDSKTGNVVWDIEVASSKAGYSITAAPLAVKDKVIIGVAGGEFGVRGLLDAYDAKTGKRAWRFWTVPVRGEQGVETWAGETWKNGSGTTWVTGSYDPETNTILWGTGNPGPDWHGEKRQGDNLYSDCLLALDADSGKLKWHFQFTPHDVHDWDSTQVPVVVDRVFQGKARKQILFANRNGFYHALDGETGKFLAGKSFAQQTWAKALDERGRPIPLPNTAPSEQGTLVYPSVPGATNYFSPSYSPQTDLFYVAAREEGSIYYTRDQEFKSGKWFLGGRWIFNPKEERYGAIRALEPDTGNVRWEFKLHSPPWAGLLSTAGNLVFGGTDEGYFLSLDAESGKLLWRFPTGGKILANPVTYMSDGKQHIAIAAGHDIFVFGLESRSK